MTVKSCKLRMIPTARIEEILSENYTRGLNDKCYEEHREELQDILWQRKDKLMEQQIKERERDEC